MNNGNTNATSRLIKGSLTYVIGNFLSRLLQIAILPLITATLLAEEYGYYDLIITSFSG